MKLIRTKQKSRDESSVQQTTQDHCAKESEKQSQDERREKNTPENDGQSANDSADEEKREQLRKKIQESINAQMAERKKREEEVAKQEAMFYNKLGMTPLSVLAAIGNLEEIKLFIENCTDLNQGCTCDGSTPLMLASQNKHKDVVEFLLRNGADCTLSNNEGNNAFMIAVRTGDAQVINIIWPFRGNLQINHANLTGSTALHIAAERKWECCVQFLLANGADPNLQTNTGLTPLMQSAMKGDPKTAERLIQAGADILKEDMNGNTAVCWSLQEAKEEVLEFLLTSLDQHKRDLFVKGRIARMNSSVENYNFDYLENILFPLILRLTKKDSFRDALYNQKIIYNIMNVMHAHVPILRDPREIRDADYLTMVVYIMCHLMFHQASIVEERFVSQFIQLKGPEFFMETSKLCEVTWKFHDRDPTIYFMPIIYLIEVPEGREYLMQNCCRVSEFSNRFRLKIDLASWRLTHECVNLKFAEMWARFCDYFGKIQSSQREQKMAELLEEEEREKQKKDKKRDKKKRKRQRNQEQNGDSKGYGENDIGIDDAIMTSVSSIDYSNQQKEKKKNNGFLQNTNFLENIHLPKPPTKRTSSQTSQNMLYGVAVETLKLHSQHSNDVMSAYENSSAEKFNLSDTNTFESETAKKKKKKTKKKKKMTYETNDKQCTPTVTAVSNEENLGPMLDFPEIDDAEQTWVTVHAKKHLPKTAQQDNNTDTDNSNKKGKQRGKKKATKHQHTTSQKEAFSWAEVAKGNFSKPRENLFTTTDLPPKADLSYEEEFPTLANHKGKEMESVESSHQLLAMEASSDTCHHSYADIVREEDPEMSICSDSTTDPMESFWSKQRSPFTAAHSDDSVSAASEYPEQAKHEVHVRHDANADIARDRVYSIPMENSSFQFRCQEELSVFPGNVFPLDISETIPNASDFLYNSRFHQQEDLDISTIPFPICGSCDFGLQETPQQMETSPDQIKSSGVSSAGNESHSVHPRLIGIWGRSRQTVAKEENIVANRDNNKTGILGKEIGSLFNSGSTQNLAIPPPSRSQSGHISMNLREEVNTANVGETSNGWSGTNTASQDLQTSAVRYEDLQHTSSPKLVRTPFRDITEKFENNKHFQQGFTRISSCYDVNQPQVRRSCGEERNELSLQDVQNIYENTLFNKIDNVNMKAGYARNTDVAPFTTNVIFQPTGTLPFHNQAGYLYAERLEVGAGPLTNIVEQTGSNLNHLSNVSFPSNPQIQAMRDTIFPSVVQSFGYSRAKFPTSRDRPEVEDPSVMDCYIEGSKPIYSKWNSLSPLGTKSSHLHANLLPSVDSLCALNNGVGFTEEGNRPSFGNTTSSLEVIFHCANPNCLENCTQTTNVIESRYDDYGSLDYSLNEKSGMGKSPYKTSSLGQSILFNACQIDTTEETVLYPSDLDNVEPPSPRKVSSLCSRNKDHQKENIQFFPSFHEETKVANETNEISMYHKIQQVQLMQLKSYYDSLQVPDSRLPLVYDNNFYYYASCTGVDMKRICEFIGAKGDEEDPVLKSMRPNTEKGNMMTDMKYGQVETKTLFEKEYGRISKCKADNFTIYDDLVKKTSTTLETGPQNERLFFMNGDWQPKSKRWAEKLRIIRRLPAGNLQRFGDILLPATDKDNYIICQGIYPTSLGFLVDGTEVAVKVIDARSVRVSRSRLERLLNISGSNFILQYLALAYSEGTIYLATELYEYTLEEHMRALCRDQGQDALSGNKLVWQFLRGVAFLQEQSQMVHGDLKPENVVVDTEGKLKIGGYGFCKEGGNNAIISQGISKRDRCWLAPEVFLGEMNHTFKSDIHVSGMLIYYILTGGKHPYGSTAYDIQINMGRKICQLFYINEEANHLLSAMLPPSPFDRPSVSEVFKHPYFWADEKKLRFVLIAGSDVLRDLKAGVPITGGSGETMIDIISAVTSDASLSNWIPEMDPLIMKEMRIFRQYKNTPVELVLFVYNCCLHFEKMAPAARDMIDEPCKYFLNRFPTLFMTVYRAIRASGRTEKTCYKPFF